MKHGSAIFVSNDFILSDKGTWMAPFIKSALSVDNIVLGKPLVKYNHCGMLIYWNGVWYVFEAGYNHDDKRAEVIKTPFDLWKSKRKENSYLIVEPKFNFLGDVLLNRAIRSLGTPYDFKSVILWQPIRQATFKKVWLGNKSKNGTKSFYCSEYVAWLYNQSTLGARFEAWPETDPEDLFNLLNQTK